MPPLRSADNLPSRARVLPCIDELFIIPVCSAPSVSSFGRSHGKRGNLQPARQGVWCLRSPSSLPRASLPRCPRVRDAGTRRAAFVFPLHHPALANSLTLPLALFCSCRGFVFGERGSGKTRPLAPSFRGSTGRCALPPSPLQANRACHVSPPVYPPTGGGSDPRSMTLAR